VAKFCTCRKSEAAQRVTLVMVYHLFVCCVTHHGVERCSDYLTSLIFYKWKPKCSLKTSFATVLCSNRSSTYISFNFLFGWKNVWNSCCVGVPGHIFGQADSSARAFPKVEAQRPRLEWNLSPWQLLSHSSKAGYYGSCIWGPAIV